MRVLIVGSDTELGIHLIQRLQERGCDFVAISSSSEFLVSSKALAACLQTERPDCVVNAYTYHLSQSPEAVDQKTALDCIKFVSKASAAVKLPLVHLSGATVFKGKSSGQYREDEKSDVSDKLGKRLYKAERYIRRKQKQHIILRMPWVFGAGGDDYFTRVLDSLLEKGEITLEQEQLISPTPANDVARVVVAILEQIDCGAEPWGVYHYCSEPMVHLSVFIEAIIAVASQYGEVEPHLRSLDLSSLNAEIPPPVNLNCKKILNTFGIRQRGWRSSLPALVRARCHNRS